MVARNHEGRRESLRNEARERNKRKEKRDNWGIKLNDPQQCY